MCYTWYRIHRNLKILCFLYFSNNFKILLTPTCVIFYLPLETAYLTGVTTMVTSNERNIISAYVF